MSRLAILGLVIFSLILSGGGAVFGIPRVQAYLQANEHEKRGDNYFNQKQYGDALSAYKLSKESFSDRTIEDKMSLSNQLSQDEEHYNNGNNAIEQESWDTAVKELSLVSQKSERYDAASKLVSYAIEKLNASAKVAAKPETKLNTVKGTEQNKSTVITTPITPITPVTPVTESVLIRLNQNEVRYFECQKDKVNEVKAAKLNANSALQEYGHCGFSFLEERSKCYDQCNADYKLESNDYDIELANRKYESCGNSCKSGSAEQACSGQENLSQKYSDILINLVSNYCK